MWHMDDGMGWWMLFGWLWFLIFWGLVIWAVATVVRRLDGGDRRVEPTALEFAARRYARGEISQEEFERIRRTLAGGG